MVRNVNLKPLSLIFLILVAPVFGGVEYGDLEPSVTNTWNLGAESFQWKNAFGDGTLDWDTILAAKATITGCSVLSLNSAVFKPTTDSTTFFRVNDKDGNVIANVDTVNNRVGVGTMGPEAELTIGDGTGYPKFRIWSEAEVYGPRYVEMYVGTFGKLHIGGTISQLYLSVGIKMEDGNQFTLGSHNDWSMGHYTGDDSFRIGNDIGLASTVKLTISKSTGNIGFGGEPAPETLTEWTHAQPHITQGCSTHSDANDSGLVIQYTKRQDGAGTETHSSSVEVSHDGAGVNDQLTKRVWKVNTGAGLVEGMRLDSTGLKITTGEAFVVGTTTWTSSDELDGTIIKDADYGDIIISAGGVWTLDTNSVAANELLSGDYGDIDIDGAGVITVEDDSHNHVYSNIDETTSSNWASRVSDETGSGVLVYNTSPTFNTSVIMSNGATLGQAAGPLLTFNDTANYLGVTGCTVGIGTTSTALWAGTGLVIEGAAIGIQFTDTTAGHDDWAIYVNDDFTIRNIDDGVYYMHIDSDGNATFADDLDVVNNFTAGTIQADNGVSGTLVLDDGTTERITLVFTGGGLTSRTIGASVGLLIDWTD